MATHLHDKFVAELKAAGFAVLFVKQNSTVLSNGPIRVQVTQKPKEPIVKNAIKRAKKLGLSPKES